MADPTLPAAGDLRIDHVGIAVPDLDAAVAFHCAAFGLREVHREVNAEQGVAEAMLAADAGARVQLPPPRPPESPTPRFLARSGPGLQQRASTGRDVEAAAAALRA